ncbi:MAG: hypothetical protein QXF15_03290 [Candidatus Aenigmatarchaeota archaeon]
MDNKTKALLLETLIALNKEDKDVLDSFAYAFNVAIQEDFVKQRGLIIARILSS